MLDDLKKELSSFKLLISLATIAVFIYLLEYVFDLLRNFSDIILIIVFGWLVSFVLEPVVDVLSIKFKIPRIISTAIVFALSGLFITVTFIIFIPDIITQFKAIDKITPDLLKNSPPQIQEGIENFIGSINNYGNLLPSITQFFVNLVTILILSFYLIIDKKNLNRKIFALSPKKYHEQIRFVQSVIDSSFASFVRVQVLWGLIGGIITWIVLTIFGVEFAASSSFLAGILTAVPVIGPLIGVIPPLLVSFISKPDQAVIIFLIIFIIQQFIFNVIGPKIMSKAFNINPIMVILSLLIGIKVAGAMGAILAVPVISIILIVGKEFYQHYIKEED